jgi:hypothetical protein
MKNDINTDSLNIPFIITENVTALFSHLAKKFGKKKKKKKKKKKQQKKKSECILI